MMRSTGLSILFAGQQWFKKGACPRSRQGQLAENVSSQKDDEEMSKINVVFDQATGINLQLY